MIAFIKRSFQSVLIFAVCLSCYLLGGQLVNRWIPDSARAAALAERRVPKTPEEVIAQFRAKPRVRVPIARNGADVLIIAFNDYQCPSCRVGHEFVRQALAALTQGERARVRVVTLAFPLDSRCNPRVTERKHPAACDAAVAVELARKTGHAEALEKTLFSEGLDLTPESVRRAAESLGVKDFDKRYEEGLKQVVADVKIGLDLGVKATPSYIVNGVVFVGGISADSLTIMIRSELSRAAG